MRSSTAPRIQHDAAVTLAAGAEPIEARAVNLSVGGIFVQAGKELDPGEPVDLKIELGDGGLPIEAKAEVVWVKQGGMALRFVRMDDTSTHRIQKLVAKRSREPTGLHPRDVRIHLASLQAPLRVVARDQSDKGLMLEAELPWLTLGQEITTELSQDRACTGIVRWVGVDVTRSGSARLRIQVDILESSDEHRVTETPPPEAAPAEASAPEEAPAAPKAPAPKAPAPKAPPINDARPSRGSSPWVAGLATAVAIGFAALWIARPPPTPILLGGTPIVEPAEGHVPPVVAIPKAPDDDTPTAQAATPAPATASAPTAQASAPPAQVSAATAKAAARHRHRK
jgi:uncharacterized protein (TIGR02266 family)